MSNKLGVTVNGVHHIGKKAYLTVDGVMRRAKKMYRVVNGVFAKCYQLGVEWMKYSCNKRTESWYTQTSSGVGSTYNPTSYWGNSYEFTFYTGYEWGGGSQGWVGTGAVSVRPQEAVGYYNVYGDMVVHIEFTVPGPASPGLPKPNTTGLGGTIVAAANYSSTTIYSKGSTNYGVVYAEEGKVPDGGSLVKGSANGSYCVAKVGSTYYYYEKV
jgi:hypothetical protein